MTLRGLVDRDTYRLRLTQREWAQKVSLPLSRGFEVYSRSIGRHDLANMYREHADWVECHGEDPLSCCVSRPENAGAS